ncbi:hypothetical protein K469DRAFT_777719 [Zopfia rhizophila CBS 207.26]|uniref:Uncharacterized protein n=1 Tax=Zopfia rhizophila CBS 207.26 TaxID=1314779 RepID=A0A6A6E477_9PEZI|nr:hypothetical protein K469DRAFT_777719 [Zopfia rhizophila CBS 207.26]
MTCEAPPFGVDVIKNVKVHSRGLKKIQKGGGQAVEHIDDWLGIKGDVKNEPQEYQSDHLDGMSSVYFQTMVVFWVSSPNHLVIVVFVEGKSTLVGRLLETFGAVAGGDMGFFGNELGLHQLEDEVLLPASTELGLNADGFYSQPSGDESDYIPGHINRGVESDYSIDHPGHGDERRIRDALLKAVLGKIHNYEENRTGLQEDANGNKVRNEKIAGQCVQFVDTMTSAPTKEIPTSAPSSEITTHHSFATPTKSFPYISSQGTQTVNPPRTQGFPHQRANAQSILTTIRDSRPKNTSRVYDPKQKEFKVCN